MLEIYLLDVFEQSQMSRKTEDSGGEARRGDNDDQKSWRQTRQAKRLLDLMLAHGEHHATELDATNRTTREGVTVGGDHDAQRADRGNL